MQKGALTTEPGGKISHKFPTKDSEVLSHHLHDAANGPHIHLETVTFLAQHFRSYVIWCATQGLLSLPIIFYFGGQSKITCNRGRGSTQDAGLSSVNGWLSKKIKKQFILFFPKPLVLVHSKTRFRKPLHLVDSLLTPSPSKRDWKHLNISQDQAQKGQWQTVANQRKPEGPHKGWPE